MRLYIPDVKTHIYVCIVVMSASVESIHLDLGQDASSTSVSSHAHRKEFNGLYDEHSTYVLG